MEVSPTELECVSNPYEPITLRRFRLKSLCAITGSRSEKFYCFSEIEKLRSLSLTKPRKDIKYHGNEIPMDLDSIGFKSPLLNAIGMSISVGGLAASKQFHSTTIAPLELLLFIEGKIGITCTEK